MNSISYTLLSDGSSDRALLPILNWLLQQHLSQYAIQDQWADLSRLPKPPKSLSECISMSIDLYPCDLLFVHRDAENQGREQRINEIKEALKQLKSFDKTVIYVIPVRMTEAWLLFDEVAIRNAASNPKRNNVLKLPDLKKLESEPDPKNLLHNLLREASGYSSSRRLKKFRPRTCVQRIAELIDDFSPLRALSAFQVLEKDIQDFAKSQLN